MFYNKNEVKPMSMDDYERARKLGDRELHARMQKNESPYLPVLDDILDGITIESHISLGLIDVPLDRIVGTATAGRTSAFAANFMPLLGSDTEFASKWGRLYDSMVSDGLRDPVVLLEYLNRFYVVEGNKRVSVSKYLGGINVEATVTRYIPRRSDDKENRIYYEFLSFYKATRINFLWFLEPGRFPELALHVGYRPDEEWSEQDIQDFRMAYFRWRDTYKQVIGVNQELPPADAMLLYMDLYGYKGVKDGSQSELKANIGKLRNEFAARARLEPAMSMMPQTESKWKISDLWKSTPTKVKAAFLYDSSADDSGWVLAHEMGRHHLEEVFGDQVQSVSREHVRPYQAESVVGDLIKDGYDVIFSASPVFQFSIGRLAMDHPEVKFLLCSHFSIYSNIRSYYLRMFEAKYLTGIIAGIMARDGRIGYVADYPIAGTIANINAFALGVQSVNPDAEVYLTWDCLADDTPRDYMVREGITTISNRDLSAPSKGSRHFGLYQMDGQDQINLAMPLWNWGALYESLIHSILKGNWNDLTDGSQSLNYWWGLSSGAIDIAMSRNVPAVTQNLVNAVRDQLQANRFSVFAGPLYDQKGVLQSDVPTLLPPEEIIRMDYLVRGIAGSIPTLSEIRPESRNVVAIAGVERLASPASLRYGEKLHEEYVKAMAEQSSDETEANRAADAGGEESK